MGIKRLRRKSSNYAKAFLLNEFDKSENKKTKSWNTFPKKFISSIFFYNILLHLHTFHFIFLDWNRRVVDGMNDSNNNTHIQCKHPCIFWLLCYFYHFIFFVRNQPTPWWFEVYPFFEAGTEIMALCEKLFLCKQFEYIECGIRLQKLQICTSSFRIYINPCFGLNLYYTLAYTYPTKVCSVNTVCNANCFYVPSNIPLPKWKHLKIRIKLLCRFSFWVRYRVS